MENEKENEKEKQLPRIALRMLCGKQFIVPFMQRGYKWTETHVEKLLLDLKAFIDSNKPMYCLQPLAVVKDMQGQGWRVLDGQQRLITIFLLHSYLFGEKPYTLRFERDGEGEKKRSHFLEHIDTCTEENAKQCIDYYFIYKAYQKIKTTFEASDWQGYHEKFRKLLNASSTENAVEVIWYVVPTDKEHDTFSHLNAGKIALTNTELIKALFLNRVSGLPEYQLEEVAALFEQMEQAVQNDNFWAMLSTYEPEAGQTRMDLIFNLVAGAKEEDCRVNPRYSYEHYFDNPVCDTLARKWEQVRHTFLRLWGMYHDVEVYHYAGFLAYYRQRNELAHTRQLLDLQRKCTHLQFIDALQRQIKGILCTEELPQVKSYAYNTTSKKQLRQLFLMHNIETILTNYRTQQKQNGLVQNYERFPFELLYRQQWDIEHIASSTNCKFNNQKDRLAWLQVMSQEIGTHILGGLFRADAKDEKPNEPSVEENNQSAQKSTLPHNEENNTEKQAWEYLKKQCDIFVAENNSNEEEFMKLYAMITTKYEELTITDVNERIADKDYIGNITLLDSHTNRSYHNAIFPRKRSCVITAKTFIPFCTCAVFYKTYRTDSALSMSTWTKRDAEAYVKDIEDKLKKYF